MKYKAKFQTKKAEKLQKQPRKKNKKAVILSSVLLFLVAAGCGIWYYLGHRSTEPVYVFPFQYVGMTEYWGDSMESYGPVTTDKIQTVFLSSTQTVTEVCVKDGDEVKKGDLLMTFDTTLDDIALERKRLEVEKLKLDLAAAKKQLEELYDMKPMEIPNFGPSEPEVGEDGEVQVVPQIFASKLYNGNSAVTPLIYWIGETHMINNNNLRELLLRAAQEQGGTATEVPEFPEEREDPEITEPTETTIPETTEATVPTTTEPTIPDTTEETVPETTEETVPETTEAPIPETTEAPIPETTEAPTEEPTTAPTQETDPPPSEENPDELDIPSNASDITPLEGEEGNEPAEPLTNIDRFYVIIKSTNKNLKNGTITAWQGLEVKVGLRGFTFRPFDATMVPDHSLMEEGDDELVELPGMDFGSGFTGAQLTQMRSEQRKKIKDLEFEIKMAEADYKIMLTEVSDGNIYSTIDGKVISLITEEEAKKESLPILKVSGGGGFYVSGSVNELDKDRLKIGQEVEVNDWRGGGSYTGTVKSIGDFPNQDESWNGMGNPMASYYPFVVFVDETADLQAGNYVSVMYAAGASQNGIYLRNPFLRKEQGRSYCMVQGEDGKLEKRYVTTGKALWGSYTEILGGITTEDLIAFPYGKNVKPGISVQEGDMSNLNG